MKTLFLLTLSCISAIDCYAAAETYSVSTRQLTILVDSQGEIVSAEAGAEKTKYQLAGFTGLAKAAKAGKVTAKALAGGGVEFRRDLGSSGTLISSFKPAPDSIKWQVKLTGAEGQHPYTVPIETSLALNGGSSPPLFWSAWGGGQGLLEKHPDLYKNYANLNPMDKALRTYWVDPLVPQPFERLKMEYGSFFRRAGGITLPIAMFVDKPNGIALSLVQSPSDTYLHMDCHTFPDQRAVFVRKNHRIVASNPIEFNMDLIVHEPDPRSGLAWMVDKYPDYFNAPNPRAHKVAGGGAYSEYETPWDPEKLKKMAFRVNWKVSVDFPYIGMFLPPVEKNVKWNRYAGGARGRWNPGDEGRFGQVSIQELADYSSDMVGDGFNVLSYFNVTEFGDKIQYPPPPGITEKSSTQPLWMDPNAFLYTNFPGAILRTPAIRWSWGGSVAMDCGEANYQEFLLEQAQRHVEEIPDAAGICIDRLDWLNQYNHNADDGITWLHNKPARYIGKSWLGASERLGAVMRKADKVLFVNPIYNRIDLMRHVDGFYQEKGNRAVDLNSCAFVALRKPQMIWTQEFDFEVNGADAFFQRALYMGSHVTVPIPGNDHSITPAPEVDKHYLRYGKLFDAIHQRKWVLKPDVISVEAATSTTKANIFEVPGGYVVPVVMAGEAAEAEVTLRHMEDVQAAEAVAILPGVEKTIPVKLKRNGGKISFSTPLKSGCAVVRLQ